MLQLNPIFTSHGVFAAHKPIRIYGDGHGTAEILFAGQTRTVTADGAWEIEFPPTKIHLAHRIVGALRELDPENP